MVAGDRQSRPLGHHGQLALSSRVDGYDEEFALRARVCIAVFLAFPVWRYVSTS